MGHNFSKSSFKVLAFDADDTLWANEHHFSNARIKLENLIVKYNPDVSIEDKLNFTEAKNLTHFGYGIKGFTLSMIETSIELSNGNVTGDEVQQIINLGKDMVSRPVKLIDGVTDTLQKLQNSFQLMVITKGDLFDQESKFARSGLSELFSSVEIVSEKNEEIYEQILKKHNIRKDQFLMVGNSLKSDILPVLNLGCQAVYIPHGTTWVHEFVEKSTVMDKGMVEIDSISDLPDWIESNGKDISNN
ncbi:MAG: HAD family hydrolase [Proteobacteria bacterium]|nr:HAD family hydrolase [Pseudomonadota bacterium]